MRVIDLQSWKRLRNHLEYYWVELFNPVDSILSTSLDCMVGILISSFNSSDHFENFPLVLSRLCLSVILPCLWILMWRIVFIDQILMKVLQTHKDLLNCAHTLSIHWPQHTLYVDSFNGIVSGYYLVTSPQFVNFPKCHFQNTILQSMTDRAQDLSIFKTLYCYQDTFISY